MENFDELAGRVEGIAQALLRLAAELEVTGVIDGPRMAADWQALLPEQRTPDTALLRSARTTLARLAGSLLQAGRNRAQAQAPQTGGHIGQNVRRAGPPQSAPPQQP